MTHSELELLISKKWAACGRCGDDYYRAVTAALVAGEMSLTPACEYLSEAYRSSLNDYLASVELLPASSPVRAEHIRQAINYRSMIEAVSDAAISSGRRRNLSADKDQMISFTSSPASGSTDARGLEG